MSIRLLLGTARKEITPTEPLPLAGFAFREGYSKGVAHPLYLRIQVLRSEDSSGRSETAILVSADIIWWCSDRVDSLLESIEKRWGVNRSAVLLNATHTHSGPQTSRRFVPCIGEFDPAYSLLLERQLLDGIEEAFRNLEQVHVERGIGECRVGMNRRRLVDGRCVMAPHETGPVDREVHVIRFATDNGKVKALVVHFACHPTTTGDDWISSEFPGVAMERLETEICPGSVALFLQGCCGDVRPGLVKDDEFYRGSDGDVVRLGGILCEDVAKVLDRGGMKVLERCHISSRSNVVALPFAELPDLSRLHQSLQEEGVPGEWSRLLLHDPSRMAPSIPLAMNVIRIAEGLSFLAMNGEVVTEYGLHVKNSYDGQVLPAAYSNGMIGYIPTARQIEEGGYESKDSHSYFGLPAAFAPEIEQIIKEGIHELVAGRITTDKGRFGW